MRILQLLIMALSVLSSLAAVASTSASSASSSSTPPRVRHRLRHHRHRHDRQHRQRWRLNSNSPSSSLSSSAVSIDRNLENMRRMSTAYEELYPRPAPYRQRNEALCEVEMNTVHMNTPTDEFDPPFFVETRCRNIAEYEHARGLFPLRPQTCVHDLLRCVQVYKDLHFSRRRIGAHSWQPFTRQSVPVSCDCMWPVEKYGSQHDRDEL